MMTGDIDLSEYMELCPLFQGHGNVIRLQSGYNALVRLAFFNDF